MMEEQNDDDPEHDHEALYESEWFIEIDLYLLEINLYYIFLLL